jgi:hypothetical protein
VAGDALEPLPFKPEHVELIRRALQGVALEGTSARAFAGAGYSSGGKTGTAQAVGARANEKYNAAKLEEHKRDHALYIAAAPIDAPTVALAVIVENAGWGSQSAAPIARRVFDYLLLGQYPSEEDLAGPAKASPARPSASRAVAARRALAGAAAARRRSFCGGGVGGAARARRPTRGWPRAPWAAPRERGPSNGRRPGSGCARCSAGFDGPLLPGDADAGAIGLTAMYSAGFDHGTRFVDHGRNMLLALAVLFVVAQVPPQKLQQLAVPLYVVGVVLLVATRCRAWASRRRAPPAGWRWARW